jgi:hypothetical protein
MVWKTEERGRLRGDFERKPMCSAVRFLAAMKKRWKRAEREVTVGVRSFVEGMFMSRAVRRDAR